jgi:predicted PurR-regulated permease PerM
VTARVIPLRSAGLVRTAAALAAGGAAVLFARWALGRSGRVIGWIIVAAIAAGLVHPVVSWLARHMRKGVAIALTAVTLLVALAIPVAVALREVGADFDRLREAAPVAAARLERDDRFGETLRDFGLTRNVKRILDDLPGRLTGGTGVDALRTAAAWGVAALVTLVITMFLVAYGPRLVHGGLRRVADPDRRRRWSVALFNAYRRWCVYFWLMIGKAAVLGALAYGIFRLVELPTPALLSLTVAVASFLPRLGVILGAVPAVLLALGMHRNVGTLVAALAVVTAVQVLDWLVTWRIVEPRSIAAGTAMTLLAFLLGLELFGLGGGLVGVAAVVGALALLDELGRRPANAEP